MVPRFGVTTLLLGMAVDVFCRRRGAVGERVLRVLLFRVLLLGKTNVKCVG